MRAGHALALMIPVMMLLASVSSLGHSPVDPEDGESLGTATHVDDPAKSWAIYGRLDPGGDTWYFEMDLAAGERLYLSLLSTQEDFWPSLVVMGPGLGRVGEVPSGVEVPATYGWTVVEGRGDGAEFEPFTPGSYYFVAEFDERVEGRGPYFVAVHSDEGEGPFSLAVGYKEEFTLAEWMALPVSLIGIYRWEGQGWVTILGPPVLVIILGLLSLLALVRRRSAGLTLFQLTSAVSGLFILGWAAVVSTQMAMAIARSGWQASALVTTGFLLASMAMGFYAYLPALRGPTVPDQGRRVGMLVVGVVSLFLYSGLYVGPVLALVAALLPQGMTGRTLMRTAPDGPAPVG